MFKNIYSRSVSIRGSTHMSVITPWERGWMACAGLGGMLQAGLESSCRRCCLDVLGKFIQMVLT